MKKYIFLFAFMAYLLSSCSEDNLGFNTACVPLSVTDVFVDNGTSVSTRGTNLTGGTSIGISRLAVNNYTAQTNLEYKYSDDKLTPQSDCILVGDNNATLCAYFPYSSSIDASKIALNSGVYCVSNDFCYAYKSDVNATNMGAGISFSFVHAYAKLTLKFTKGSSFAGAGNVKSIKISGAAKSANLDISSANAVVSTPISGDVTAFDDATATKFNIVTSSSSSCNVEMLMVPTTIAASGLTFTINVDGHDKTATLPQASLSKLSANTHYTIPIEIGSILDLGGATGTNYVTTSSWEDISSVSKPVQDIIIKPESNCYMVAPGDSIYIPVSRASAFAKDNKLENWFCTTSAFTTGLLWSDVSATHVTAHRIGRFIKVVANLTEGNSVIYAKRDTFMYTKESPTEKVKQTDIVWSWHIWVTSYNNGKIYNSSTGFWLMDRNLGAIVSAGTVVTPGVTEDKNVYETFKKCGGLMYQWGRKDPFPGSNSTVVVKDIPTIGEKLSDNVNYYLISDKTSALVYSIKSPLTFFGGWSGSSWSPTGKTFYDPCPFGWRVPGITCWESTMSPKKFTKIGISTSTTCDFGSTLNFGFYPLAGYRDLKVLSSVGDHGCVWSSTQNSNGTSYNLGMDKSLGWTNGDHFSPAYGFNVRCVRE
jgi:hypothetical protein